MGRKILFGVIGFFGISVGLYPSLYFFIDREFGLLSDKSEALLSNVFWNTGFYTHIIFGGLALLIGWVQFSKRIRLKYAKTHRTIGKIYVLSAFLSGIAGFQIGFSATGGTIAKLGFILLAIIWLGTTLSAYVSIKKGSIEKHQKMMIYSYAACFSAVTLRIWLPLLISYFQGDFEAGYRIVAWLCWMPNLIVAYFIVRNLSKNSVAQ